MEPIILLEEIFNALNNNTVRYCIMRDYESIDNILKGEDIDIVVHIADRAKVIAILEQHNWQSPKHNFNYHGHQQFFKWDGTRVVKLDILFGLFFGNGCYSMVDQDRIFDNTHLVGFIRIPSYEDGLLIQLCHICLDKKCISDKNQKFLEYLCAKVRKEDRPDLYDYIFLIKKNKDNPESFSRVREKMIQRGAIIGHNKLTRKSVWVIKKALAHFVMKQQLTVAIIGVDGSGKSTSVDALKQHYGDMVFTQYFGFRQHKTSLAQKRYSGYKHIPVISFIIDCIVLFYEMKYRYREAISSGKRILLFDRYPWEAYDNTSGKIAKFINFIVFKVPFRKPDGIVYLHCPVVVSLSRKDDITDVAGFKRMKFNFDKTYKDLPGVLEIDTSCVSREEVKCKTVEYVCMLDSLL